jgi:hypothetical protein
MLSFCRIEFALSKKNVLLYFHNDKARSNYEQSATEKRYR